MKALDPSATFVHLHADGSSTEVTVTPDVFRTLRMEPGDRLIGAARARTADDFHPGQWEMHPSGDEVLALVSGAVDLIFDDAGGERRVALEAGQVCVVPRGTWHRFVVHAPATLLFNTPGAGTQHKPV